MESSRDKHCDETSDNEDDPFIIASKQRRQSTPLRTLLPDIWQILAILFALLSLLLAFRLHNVNKLGNYERGFSTDLGNT